MPRRRFRIEHSQAFAQLPFRLLTPGSALFAVTWILGSLAFGRYVSHFGTYEVTYGALGGVIVLRRRGDPLRILLVPLLFVTLVGALSYGSTRFRVAAEPAIVVLAAVGGAALWNRVRARRGADAERKMQAA